MSEVTHVKARRIVPIIAHFRRKVTGQVVPVSGSVKICKERFLQMSVSDELFGQAKMCKEEFFQMTISEESMT